MPAARARSCAGLPKPFLQTRFITERDLEDDAAKNLSADCKAVNVPIVGEVEKLTLATLAPRDMTTIRKGHAG